MAEKHRLSRRGSMKSMGALGAATFFGSQVSTAAPAAATVVGKDVETGDVRKQVAEKVWSTSFVDTHEHLVEEKVRLMPETMPLIQCNDWALLVAGYLFSDLTTAGLPAGKGTTWAQHELFSKQVDPIKKWSIIEPYWPAVKIGEGWLGLDDALELVEPIMRGNARRLFDLGQKEKLLRRAPWV